MGSGILVWTLPNKPLISPIIAQINTCHIAHGPIPKYKFDRIVLNTAMTIASIGLTRKEAIIIMVVIGCTFGMKVKIIRPTTAMVINIANKLIRLAFILNITPKLQGLKTLRHHLQLLNHWHRQQLIRHSLKYIYIYYHH